ncbi:ribonucleoside-diphosphate reductase subunit alpha [Candidatus Vallotiella sp. (ex Adelges kitamiensis)]|uniref:ribonucleoside-diphosphate reductase subunit alpha n=1 Tax=Candidatus Vallotiella sp. (ex Adelges kitamiensis) TaxID=2864217 RepID=UPI001CE2E87D|nr:ribonucleoside-diphosphate reductase subunit alpha [Candidatus Vallotia sp. (ex Adelges kitamiensis)]
MQPIENAMSHQPDAAARLPYSGNTAYESRTLAPQAEFTDYKVILRNGSVMSFEPSKITIAISKAFLAVNGNHGAMSARVRELIETITNRLVHALIRSRPHGGTFHIEDIQDQVELALMRAGEHNVARAYVLYREKRAAERMYKVEHRPVQGELSVSDNGIMRPLDLTVLCSVITAACEGFNDIVSVESVLAETIKNLYDGVPLLRVYDSAILAARTMIEREPAYSQVTARLLLHVIRREVLGEEVLQSEMEGRYAKYFEQFLRRGVEAELLDEKLLQFDLKKLADALDASRDLKFSYLGLQTLYDRYFLHIDGERIEMPQAFFMRVAMGLALNESDRETQAISFYNVLSTFDFMSSTPTLFNSGTRRSQMSSCYLTTVSDDLDGIYEALKENALLSKFAGGLGNDWTRVRALGSHIKGTNGKSQGVVPFLKVVNDTAVAVNQGGKRKGAVCTYLETWHLDIEEFLELRKNTGDDRRRTHDMNTANWIPDLFMKRVIEGGDWTLFSPSTCSDLHEKFGTEFEEAYVKYEEKAECGELKLFKKIPAVQLWRKMLGMLFETGHPWITFKDPCNICSPQQHVGIVHSSNLCTEVTLNTSDNEIAVCNLGSVNLVAHMKQGLDGSYVLDHDKLKHTISIAMRMLDNVIDINYYAVSKARNSNLRHRPVGMGIMGFQDCLYLLRTPYASQQAIEFADRSMEAVCYYSYSASVELASERGCYSSYHGSLWDRGILPQDTLKLLADSRGGYVEVDSSESMDWAALRERITMHGIRNSNCIAIAPTATISNIVGVSACIEPTFQNLYVKSNLSGEFTVVNGYLVRDLKACGLWDEVMVADLKYFDGSLARIDRIPVDLRETYATAFEVDPKWLVEAAARRQKWIDQAQSLNIYMASASGKKLEEIYKLAWLRGLKTTYYLRTLAATHVEKSTVTRGTLNAVQSNMTACYDDIRTRIDAKSHDEIAEPVCMLSPSDTGFDECEACQ